ncbi:uncharacterized protein LOC115785244 isoform X1 [Archocentrus centrarchus]|uniref:uncharacterized protein LOC115785244 isoform X1 n=2 Tax=Archocentrus centrarchus TaxID=63155 RepID=UPI0011E9E459|nr:uncharacterized protein LOC115785244 isoform X1 [Archocentrus centrarchus]
MDIGYLAWRLKTIQRKSTLSEGRRSSCQLTGCGPTARGDASFNPEVTLREEPYKEANSFMKYSSDEAAIRNKMKMMFDYRCKMVLDENRSSSVLTEFPRFRDVRGLIEQDFILEFGEDVATRFLERWPTVFKHKVIQQSKTLPTSTDLEEVIYCAEGASSEEELDETLTSGWDSDLASIILLFHLIPPSCQGYKRRGKVSPSQDEEHHVVFQKVCNSGTSVQEHADAMNSTTQPYPLAVGTKRSTIHEFFIVLDKQVVPCKSASSLGAFDEIFHFVFGTVYNQILHNMYVLELGELKEGAEIASELCSELSLSPCQTQNYFQLGLQNFIGNNIFLIGHW